MNAVFTCSIDDGHPSDLRMADLLSKHGLNGTFFIPVRNREGLPVMSGAQIRDVGQRFEIGSHTYDHCYLNSVNLDDARFQIMEGKIQLEDLLGKEVTGFCYPGGKYWKKHASLVRRAGFLYARTTTNLCFDAGDSLYEIPTTIQFYPHARNVYLRNFVKGMQWKRRRDGLAIALHHDNWVDRLYALFDHACARQGVFHLWAHSHDIDRLDAWSEVDRLLSYVAQKVTPPNRLDNRQLAKRELAL